VGGSTRPRCRQDAGATGAALRPRGSGATDGGRVPRGRDGAADAPGDGLRHRGPEGRRPAHGGGAGVGTAVSWQVAACAAGSSRHADSIGVGDGVPSAGNSSPCACTLARSSGRLRKGQRRGAFALRSAAAKGCLCKLRPRRRAECLHGTAEMRPRRPHGERPDFAEHGTTDRTGSRQHIDGHGMNGNTSTATHRPPRAARASRRSG
jgi:hypothetical protein